MDFILFWCACSWASPHWITHVHKGIRFCIFSDTIVQNWWWRAWNKRTHSSGWTAQEDHQASECLNDKHMGSEKRRRRDTTTYGLGNLIRRDFSFVKVVNDHNWAIILSPNGVLNILFYFTPSDNKKYSWPLQPMNRRRRRGGWRLIEMKLLSKWVSCWWW